MTCLGPTSAVAEQWTVTDDLGREITLNAPAMRIIALYGAYNEILGAMGLENRLVGRTKADNRPPSIMEKPSIGTHMRPNVEMVLALKPDLILQSAGRREALMVVEQLRKEGLPVAVFHPVRFHDLFSVIHRLGTLTGEQKAGDRLVRSLEARLSAVDVRLKDLADRPKVFFEVRYPNLLGAGRGSIVNEIIQRSGGRNCLTHDKKLVRVGIETLIKTDPEVYLIQQGPMNRNPSPPAKRPHFHVLKAVKEKRTKVVEEQIYSRPGPRCIDAVEELARFLHPERFTEQSFVIGH